MTGAPNGNAAPMVDRVREYVLAAADAREAHAHRVSVGDWSGALAAVDRERRHLEAAAAMLDDSAELSAIIGDRAGARAYRARAASVRAWAAVL